MKYKKGDVVLVKSRAGDSIPKIHVKLLNRIVVKGKKGKYVGLRKTMDWPGYSGWEAVTVYQSEIDILRKRWGIPYKKPGEDILFIYDGDIISIEKKKGDKKRRIVRKTS
jgi:hypothetical protein